MGRNSTGPCTACLRFSYVRGFTNPSLHGTEPLTPAPLDIYHQAGFSDSRWLKSLVYFVFMFETVQTVLLTHDTFHELAISFGNYQGLLNPYYIWFDLPVQSAIRMCSIPSSIVLLTSASIVSSITQCFYAWRIKVLGNSRIISLSIVAVSNVLSSNDLQLI